MYRRDEGNKKMYGCPMVNKEYISILRNVPLNEETYSDGFIALNNALINEFGKGERIRYFDT